MHEIDDEGDGRISHCHCRHRHHRRNAGRNGRGAAGDGRGGVGSLQGGDVRREKQNLIPTAIVIAAGKSSSNGNPVGQHLQIGNDNDTNLYDNQLLIMMMMMMMMIRTMSQLHCLTLNTRY